MSPIVYAVGDVHGRDDLLGELHEHIRNHHHFMHPGLDAEIVHVGDYIDRGAQSVAVIDRLMRDIDGFRTTCLLGNHEAMLLECLATDNRQAWHTWLSNGGDDTLASLGMPLHFGEYDPKALGSCLGADRVSWLKSLPLSHSVGPYLFVHAGIAPGVPLEAQQPKDLLWIRSRFLESEADHGCIVVHGHTPGDAPVVRHNRICVDTDATANGVLTAAVLTGEDPPLFLRAIGAPGRGG